jgi:RNA polymerase sigma-70 factor, ECF subfamily
VENRHLSPYDANYQGKLPGMTARKLDPERLGDHLDRLFRAAWAMCGSRETAEDLVQETYARVLAHPRFLRNEDDLGYLLRALRNTHASQRRTASRRPRSDMAVEDLDPAEERTSAQPEQAAEARLVYAAISALPDEFREALVAIDVVGLSYDEAASALRVPAGTVTSRLFRARRQVAQELRSQEPDAITG